MFITAPLQIQIQIQFNSKFNHHLQLSHHTWLLHLQPTHQILLSLPTKWVDSIYLTGMYACFFISTLHSLRKQSFDFSSLFQSCLGTTHQREVLQQRSTTPRRPLLFSEILQRWPSHRRSHRSLRHRSRVLFIITVTLIFIIFIFIFHTPFHSITHLCLKLSRHAWHMDEGAGGSMETHRRCCSRQRRYLLPSDLARGKSFKHR